MVIDLNKKNHEEQYNLLISSVNSFKCFLNVGRSDENCIASVIFANSSWSSTTSQQPNILFIYLTKTNRNAFNCIIANVT